jgi:hypothetical protein
MIVFVFRISEEDDEKVKPKHPLLVEAEEVLFKVRSSLSLLTTRPIEKDAVSNALR